MNETHSKLSSINSRDVPFLGPDGRSKLVQVAIPEAWANDIAELVRSPRSPYRSRAEFLRHAIGSLRLQLLAEPDIGKALRDFEQGADYYQVLTTRLASVVRFHLPWGPAGIRHACKIVHQIWELTRQMSHGYWRERCLDHLDRFYGHMIRAYAQENGVGES